MIKQLSVFVEDKMGELTRITSLLSDNNISIKSINLIDSSDFGLLRIIADDYKKASDILSKNGFSLTITDVLGVEIENRVGSFNDVVKILSENEINIEYLYTVDSDTYGIFIFKVSRRDLKKAYDLLKQSNIKVLDGF